MVIKKTDVKQTAKRNIKKKIENKLSISTSENKKEDNEFIYHPVITSFEIIVTERYDFNWVGIRREIQKFNFLKKKENELNKENLIVCESNSLGDLLKKYDEEYNKKQSANILKDKSEIDFNYKTAFNNLWDGYCNWFNSIFNKEE